MEDKFSQPIYGTTEDSQCKNCVYNYEFDVCKHYETLTPMRYLLNKEKCPFKTHDNAK